MNKEIENEFKGVYKKILSMEKRQSRIIGILETLINKLNDR